MSLFKKHYLPSNKTLWQGRADSKPEERFFQVVKMLDLGREKIFIEKESSFALVGFCCDVGVRRNLGRVGAKQGPTVLRQALAKLPLSLEKSVHLVDVGDIHCDDDDLEGAQAALGDLVANLLNAGFKPIVIGGGHEVAFGHFCGIESAFAKKIGIINFDAHFDLRPYESRGNSGTPFSQIADLCLSKGRNFNYFCLGIQPYGNTKSLFQRAEELNVTTIFAEEIFSEEKQVLEKLDTFLHAHDAIYLTLCMDVFAQAFAPGVSAPQPLGLFPHQVKLLLNHIVKSKKVISFDVAELAPALDINNMTASLAASMIAEYILR